VRDLDEYSVGTDGRPPGPIEYFDEEHSSGSYNAGARSPYCGLHFIVFATEFLLFRWRSAIPDQERFSCAFFGVVPHSAARRTETGPPTTAMLDGPPAPFTR
jgi:hypothetical protein